MPKKKSDVDFAGVVRVLEQIRDELSLLNEKRAVSVEENNSVECVESDMGGLGSLEVVSFDEAPQERVIEENVVSSVQEETPVLEKVVPEKTITLDVRWWKSPAGLVVGWLVFVVFASVLFWVIASRGGL